MISWVMFTVWLGGLGFYGSRLTDHPLGPWRHVALAPYVQIVNLTPDSIPACTIAPEVDQAIRCLGWTPAQDSTVFRLPYADTWVILLVGTSWLRVDARRPGIARVVVVPMPPVFGNPSKGGS